MEDYQISLHYIYTLAREGLYTRIKREEMRLNECPDPSLDASWLNQYRIDLDEIDRLIQDDIRSSCG